MSQEIYNPFTPLKERRSNSVPENVQFSVSSIEFDNNFPSITISGEQVESETLPYEVQCLNDGDHLPELFRDKFDYQNLLCKPLQEVNPDFVGNETFIVIGKDWQIKRFTGKKSSFILNPFNPVRKHGIFILSSWHLSLLVGISLSIFCFSFVLPNYSSSTNAFATDLWRATRFIFGSVLLGEIVLKVVARGVLVTEFTYLRSPWDWLDIAVFLIIFFNIFWKSFLLRALQGIALLKFIPIVPALKNGFQDTVQILKNLVPVLIYSLLTLWVLVILGWHVTNSQSPLMAHNSTHRNCSESEYDDSHVPTATKSNDTFPPHGSILSNYCNITSNHALPILNLTLETASMMTFKALGEIEENDSKLWNHLLYVVLTLFFGTLGISLLTCASVGCTLYLIGSHNPYSCCVGFIKINKHRKFMCLPKVPKCDTLSAFKGIQGFVFHYFVELFMTMVIIVDICLIVLSQVFGDSNEEIWWMKVFWAGQEVCMIIYVIEAGLKSSVPSRFFRNCWPLIDLFVVGIYFIDKITPLPKVLLRIRVLKIVSRWPTLETIFSILFAALSTRMNVLCVLGLITVSTCLGSSYEMSSDNQNRKSVPPSLVFLFNDWITLFASCTDVLPICLGLWNLQIVTGVVLGAVIFVTVINTTCDLISRPAELGCDNSNYRKLCQAMEQIRNKLKNKCFQTTPEEPPQSANNEINTNASYQTQTPTTNGGLHLIVPVIKVNEVPLTITASGDDHNDAQEEEKGITSTPLSSIIPYIRNCQLSSYLSTGIILITTVFSAVRFEILHRFSPLENPRLYIDLVFVCYFLLILLWKLVKNNFKLLKSPPWILDFLIVSATGFTIYTSMSCSNTTHNLPIVKAIATLSCLKGLMLVHSVEWIKVAVTAATSLVRLTWRYLFGVFVIWMFVHWLSEEIFSNTWLMVGKSNGLNVTFGSALMKTSFQTGRFVVHVTLFGVFIGVIISELLRNELLGFFMTSAQCAIYKDKELSYQREKTLHIPAPKKGLCIQITHYISLTRVFDMSVVAVIICDCLVITFGSLATSKDWKVIWSYHPALIIFLYATEIGVKLLGWRKHFWRSKLNLYDIMVVIAGLTDLYIIKFQLGFITAETLRFFRILRLSQLPVFKHKFMKLFSSSCVRVLPCVTNILLTLALIIYTYVIIGIEHDVNSFPVKGSLDLMQAPSQINDLLVSLIQLPPFGDNKGFHIAQVQPGWANSTGIFLIGYIYSFLALSYLLSGTICAIILCEVSKTLSKGKNLQQKRPTGLSLNVPESGNRYKHNNGRFLSLDYGRSPDDQDSSQATVLTPIEPEREGEDPLGEEDKYPVRMSMNGCVLHVEALVTTV